ncbi:MAG: tetratricopeptide repeat protein [Promethearchaeota archaeon]
MTALSNKITNVFTSAVYIKWWTEFFRLYFLTGINDKDFRDLEEIYNEAREFLPPWLYSDYGAGLFILYSRSGQYSKVIEVASKIYKIVQKVNNLHSLAWIKRTLGDAYVQMGDILKGKRLIEEALKINREIDDPTCLALCLVEVGKLNYYLGKTENALDHLKEAIGLFAEEKSLMFLSPYYFFVLLLLEQGKKTEVEKVVDTLKQRYQKFSSTNFSSFVEALLLKYETRATKKVMVQTKLEQLLKTPPEGKWFKQEIYFYVVIHYLDLLVHEFNEFQEQEVLEEISTILDETKKLAKRYCQTNFLVQFSIIEAKLFLIQDKFQEAHELLETLVQRASVVNIPRLKSQVE